MRVFAMRVFFFVGTCGNYCYVCEVIRSIFCYLGCLWSIVSLCKQREYCMAMRTVHVLLAGYHLSKVQVRKNNTQQQHQKREKKKRKESPDVGLEPTASR